MPVPKKRKSSSKYLEIPSYLDSSSFCFSNSNFDVFLNFLIVVTSLVMKLIVWAMASLPKSYVSSNSHDLTSSLYVHESWFTFGKEQILVKFPFVRLPHSTLNSCPNLNWTVCCPETVKNSIKSKLIKNKNKMIQYIPVSMYHVHISDLSLGALKAMMSL